MKTRKSFWNANKRTLNWTLQQGFRRKQTQTTGEEPLKNFTDTTKMIIANGFFHRKIEITFLSTNNKDQTIAKGQTKALGPQLSIWWSCRTA